MRDSEFRVLLDLMMVSDPWPLGQSELATFKSHMLNESNKRGYDDTIIAYHNFLQKGHKKALPTKTKYKRRTKAKVKKDE